MPAATSRPNSRNVLPTVIDGGHFTFTGLEAGDHELLFLDCHRWMYAFSSYPDDEYGWDGRVHLDDGEAKTVDQTMILGGFLAGSFEDEAGNPISTDSPVAVVAEGAAGFLARTFHEGAQWRFGPLAPSQYRLLHPADEANEYGESWYGGADEAHATVLDVASEQTISGLTLVLPHLGRSTISGTITDRDTHEPIEGICVSAGDRDGVTDAEGRYEVR